MPSVFSCPFLLFPEVSRLLSGMPVLTARSVDSHPPKNNNDGEAQYQAEILKLNTKNFFLSFLFTNFEQSY
jgi:hypothetical protein